MTIDDDWVEYRFSANIDDSFPCQFLVDGLYLNTNTCEFSAIPSQFPDTFNFTDGVGIIDLDTEDWTPGVTQIEVRFDGDATHKPASLVLVWSPMP